VFFLISKLFWFFARPLNLLYFAVIGAMLLARFGWRRLARRIVIVAAATFAVIGFTQLPDLLAYRLETAVPPAELPENPAGIVVLGGGLAANAQAGTGYHLGESADRLVKGLELRRRFPDARFIYSGGLGSPLRPGAPEAGAAQAMTEALYGDMRGLELEPNARNTWQNAQFVAQMAGGGSGIWILVTSGFHMPRALGAFRKSGMTVVPVATDFRADEITFPYLTGESSYQFLKFSLVVRELIGLVAYRVTGRTDELFPR
jgi:uncharacterized SAM-binding protein YcdF (DUF218 family)